MSKPITAPSIEEQIRRYGKPIKDMSTDEFRQALRASLHREKEIIDRGNEQMRAQAQEEPTSDATATAYFTPPGL